MALEEALQDQENRVESLLTAANTCVKTLKAWRKACQAGQLANIPKHAETAENELRALTRGTIDAGGSWQFDVGAYLGGDAWRNELQQIAAQKFGLRTLEDGNTLISSPIVVRAQPTRSALQLGKSRWSNIRPSVVATELKRLRDKTAGANSQEFLESLLAACEYLGSKKEPKGKLRDIYGLFCLTPGYKKENPVAAFAQQVYALHLADIKTRAGYTCEFEFTSGNAKESDVFSVMTEDGRLARYYSIWFRGV